MATADGRTPELVRREIDAERTDLAHAVEGLRAGLGEVTDGKLPVAAAGALGAGFVVAGGIGATARLLMRRGRERRPKPRHGLFSFVRR